MKIFDTDVLIWLQRGSNKAIKVVEGTTERYISVQTYMELLQCAQGKDQLKIIKTFLHEFAFHTLPLTENIGHRAAIYIEEYALHAGVRAGDAIIAATAIENHLPLITANKKHFKNIPGLTLEIFTP